MRGPGRNNLKSEVDVRLPTLLSSNTEHFYMFIGRAEYIIFNSKKEMYQMCLMSSFNVIMNWWLTNLPLITTFIIITKFFMYFVCFELLIYCLCWKAFIWKMITKKKVDLYLERALSKFKWVSRNADNLFFKLYMRQLR